MGMTLRYSKFLTVLLTMIISLALFAPLVGATRAGGLEGGAQGGGNTTTSNTIEVTNTQDQKKIADVFTKPIKIKTKNGSEDNVITYEGTQNKLVFDMGAFNNSSMSEQRDVMNEFVKRINKAGVSESTRTTIYNELSNNGGNELSPYLMTGLLDEISATSQWAKVMDIVRPFIPFLSVVIGLITFAILAFTGIVTAMDIFFMTLPVFRNYLTNNSENSGKKIPLVSTAAQYVVTQQETSSDSYKSPILMYMKLRTLDLIFLGISLFYLLFGGLSRLISGLMQMVSGFGI